MSKQYQNLKRWRKRTKQRMIDSFGGKCGICSYDKCNRALEFHHLDPKTKLFRLSRNTRVKNSWEQIVIELRKCVCLCSNCHVEVEDGLVLIPKNIKRFNEKYADYKEVKRINQFDTCPICGGKKHKKRKTCSVKCAGISRCKIKWNDTLLLNLWNQGMNYSELSIKFGVSDVAIKKRLTKIMS